MGLLIRLLVIGLLITAGYVHLNGRDFSQLLTVPCDCGGRDLDCPDFNSHNAAQACFNYCQFTTGGDVHRLDGDKDKLACETLP